MFINMNLSSNNEESFANSSRSVFFCPSFPQFIWDFKQTISLQLSVAVATIACPFIVVLNVLVIVAVKKVGELQTNSNILISSLAVADLLVGAVSLPLAISADALFLQGNVSEDMICTIDQIGGFVLYTTYRVSFNHLVLIAWERYVAVAKWREYKVLVTKGRVKRYTAIAWITALITAVLLVTLTGAGVHYNVLRVIITIFNLGWIIGFSLMVYFYCKIYVTKRKRQQNQNCQVNALIKARAESKIAYTMFLLTVAVLISGVPPIVVFVVSASSSYFRTSSAIRWAEILLQLNSLLDPALYFYRNSRYRKAVLNLLGFAKSQEIQAEVRMRRRSRRHRNSVASIDLEEFVNRKRGPHRTRSFSEGTQGRRNALRSVSDGKVIERRMTAPSLSSNLRDARQPVTLTGRDNLRDARQPVTLTGRNNLRDARQPVTLTGRDNLRDAQQLVTLTGRDNLRDAQQPVTLTGHDDLRDAQQPVTLTGRDDLHDAEQLSTLTGRDNLHDAQQPVTLTDRDNLRDAQPVTLTGRDNVRDAQQPITLTDRDDLRDTQQPVSRTGRDNLRDAQPITLTVTAQIESEPKRKRLKSNLKLSKDASERQKTQTAFIVPTSAHQNVAKVKRNSLG